MLPGIGHDEQLAEAASISRIREHASRHGAGESEVSRRAEVESREAKSFLSLI